MQLTRGGIGVPHDVGIRIPPLAWHEHADNGSVATASEFAEAEEGMKYEKVVTGFVFGAAITMANYVGTFVIAYGCMVLGIHPVTMGEIRHELFMVTVTVMLAALYYEFKTANSLPF
jgi:hypothetical protein